MRIVKKTTGVTNRSKGGPTVLGAMTKATADEAPSGHPEQVGVARSQTKIIMKRQAIQLDMTKRAEQSRVIEEGDTVIRVGEEHDSTTTHHDSGRLPLLSLLPKTPNRTLHIPNLPRIVKRMLATEEHQKCSIRDRNNDSRHPKPKQHPSQISLNSVWDET